MTLYLIRHGATAGNLERRYVGKTDEPLCETGREQVKALRAHLPGVEQVFTSPMRRCVETAELLFPEQRAERIADLRECNFGSFEYRTYEQLEGNREYRDWIADLPGACPPGGESRTDFHTRVERCLCRQMDALCREGIQTAAFVGHGGVWMAALAKFCRPARAFYAYQLEPAGAFCARTVSPDQEGRCLELVGEITCR